MTNEEIAHLMQVVDHYDSVEWNPDAPDTSGRGYQRDVLLEWQQGIIWLELHDDKINEPRIVVRHLRGTDCIPMGVLAQADGNMHRLADRPGGIPPKTKVADLPAGVAVTLTVDRWEVTDANQEPTV